MSYSANACGNRNGIGERVRAGAQTLKLLGTPRAYLILRSLSAGPKGQLALRRAAGSPAQSTLRSQLRILEAIGTITKIRAASSPSALEYRLSASGSDLLVVVAHLRHWLADSPNTAFELGTDAAKASVKSLVDAWLTTMLAPLSERELTLTELNRELVTISYPTIERHLEAMCLAEQVKPLERTGRGTPYMVTDWLRRGIAPLVAAARWEHRHRPDGATPITRLDVESAVTIAAPLLNLPSSLSGVCEMAAGPAGAAARDNRTMGVLELRNGRPLFGAVFPERKPDVWVRGTGEAWFSAVIDGDRDELEISGEQELIGTFLAGVHEALFPPRAVEPDTQRKGRIDLFQDKTD